MYSTYAALRVACFSLWAAPTGEDSARLQSVPSLSSSLPHFFLPLLASLPLMCIWLREEALQPVNDYFHLFTFLKDEEDGGKSAVLVSRYYLKTRYSKLQKSGVPISMIFVLFYDLMIIKIVIAFCCVALLVHSIIWSQFPMRFLINCQQQHHYLCAQRNYLCTQRNYLCTRACSISW